MMFSPVRPHRRSPRLKSLASMTYDPWCPRLLAVHGTDQSRRTIGGLEQVLFFARFSKECEIFAHEFELPQTEFVACWSSWRDAQAGGSVALPRCGLRCSAGGSVCAARRRR